MMPTERRPDIAALNVVLALLLREPPLDELERDPS
jgi:hypothetical protein